MIRTVVVNGQLQDNGVGKPATVSLTYEDNDPTPAGPARQRAMAVGTTVVVGDFPTLTGTGRNAGAKFCRTFSGVGEGILPWGHQRRHLPAGVAEFHSFKDWPSDAAVVAAVNALLDGMPAALLPPNAPLLPDLTVYDPDGYAPPPVDAGQLEAALVGGFSFLLTYCHEGEGNFLQAGLPVREWRRRHRLVYQTVRRHRNGARVGYIPIQTGTWTDAVSKPGLPKGDRDPLAWWAGVGDYAGWDAYALSVTIKAAAPELYPAPVAFLELPVQLARATGRRLFLPELGVIRQGSAARPDSGAMRADWIADVIAYLDEVGCAGVAWWDALGANSRDFRLLDAPSQQAWQAAIAGER